MLSHSAFLFLAAVFHVSQLCPAAEVARVAQWCQWYVCRGTSTPVGAVRVVCGRYAWYGGPAITQEKRKEEK